MWLHIPSGEVQICFRSSRVCNWAPDSTSQHVSDDPKGGTLHTRELRKNNRMSSDQILWYDGMFQQAQVTRRLVRNMVPTERAARTIQHPA
jgi:hypothetical protein